MGVTAALAIGATGAGCGVWVRGPELPAHEPAASVYIADYGRHSTLILPRGDGSATEYAYGQWDWFALGKQEPWRGPLVLLTPSRATLGLRHLPREPASAADLERQLGVPTAYEVRVRRGEVERLRRGLDDLFAAGADRAVHNADFGLDFVPVEGVYWLPYNCNTAVARWMGDLDCRVSGLAVLSDFTVRPAWGREGDGGDAAAEGLRVDRGGGDQAWAFSGEPRPTFGLHLEGVAAGKAPRRGDPRHVRAEEVRSDSAVPLGAPAGGAGAGQEVGR